MKIIKITICGGHLTPALALIEELQGEKRLKIVFFGRKFATEGSKNLSAEYRTIVKKNIKFYTLIAARLQRRFTRYTIPSLLKFPFGFIQSLIYLLKERPTLIVSFGGYLSVPVVFCGWFLGIDSITHEQAHVPGLATKLNSLFVKRIFLSHSATKNYFDSEKTEVIGNLIRKSLLLRTATSKNLSLFLKKAKNLILITGGNQGSHILNKIILENLSLFDEFYLLHQVGTANWQGDWDEAKKIKKANYLAVDYLDSGDFGAALGCAKLVVSRAGANTVWELAYLQKPAILIPLPISAGHEQEVNAQILEKAGFAKIINQKELTLKVLMKTINEVFKNYQEYQNSATKFGKSMPREGSEKLAKFILGYT